MTSDNQARLHVQAGRLRAVGAAPYLATALWSIHIVESSIVPSCGVDKHWRMYYNPEYVMNLDIVEMAGVWLHEVWHLLRDHLPRRVNLGIDDSDAGRCMIWNYAADMEINDDLTETNLYRAHDKHSFRLPEGAIFPNAFGFDKNELTEYYYEQLIKNSKCVNCGKSIFKKEGSDNKDSCKCPPTCVSGQDGSGAGGAPGEWEKGKDITGKDTSKGISEAEGKLIQRKTAEDIQKNIGKLPGHAKRWADTIINPTVDWRQLLSAHIKQSISYSAGMVDYTYRRPSRRQSIFRNFVMPSLRAPNPNVVIVIDTSGSMSEKDLQMCLAETKGVLNASQAQVTVYTIDTTVYKKQTIYDPKEIELIGGGGTDMRVGIEEAAKGRANICIVMTDGYTPWPETKPKGLGALIVCLIGNSRWGTPSEPPEWSKVVKVNYDD